MTMTAISRFARTLTLAFLVALVAPAAMAQELSPEHLALARKYVDMTDQAGIYEITVVQTGIQTMQALITQKPDAGAQIDEAIGKVITTYRDRKGELMDQLARVYALRFTMDELSQIVAFYETPVGKKLAEGNPGINKELAIVMNVFRNNLDTEFLAAVRGELRTAGINL